MACSVTEPAVFQSFVREARSNGKWEKVQQLAKSHFGGRLANAGQVFDDAYNIIDEVQSEYDNSNWFLQAITNLKSERNDKLESLVNNNYSILSNAGTSLALAESLVGAEQAIEDIADPEKRQQMLDSLDQAWEYAKENPGKAGFEAAWGIVKSTAADVWELGGDTIEMLYEGAISNDPLLESLSTTRGWHSPHRRSQSR